MLLEDFQTFIAPEINKETVHVKATALKSGDFSAWEDFFDEDRLRSVIFGLLRQNFYSFLEALEEASVSAVKAVMRDVAVNFASSSSAVASSRTNASANSGANAVSPKKKGSSPPPSSSTSSTLTSLVSEYASVASSEDWVDLFDVLAGSLLVLLHRIYVIHKVGAEKKDWMVLRIARSGFIFS